MSRILLDEVSPITVQSERISITKIEPLVVLAHDDVALVVDYSRCFENYSDAENEFPGGGVMLPLELRVTGPSGTRTRTFSLFAPTELFFRPDEGGTWVITLRETAHNLFWGTITVEVAGDVIR